MINDKFIHIHIPRTGGQRLRAIFNNESRKFKFLIKNSHMTLEESLIELAKVDSNLSVPTFCVVRNPWDWYVSRYFFRQKKDKVSSKQVLDIERYGNNKGGFQKHLLILREHINSGTKIEPISGGMPRIWRKLTLSQFYNDMTEDKMNYVAKMESFASDMTKILNVIDGDIFPLTGTLEKLKKKFNHSKHDHYRSYYTDDLAQLVAKWDEEYIDKFNYTF